MAKKRKASMSMPAVPREAFYVGGALVAAGGLWWWWSSRRQGNEQSVLADPSFQVWLMLYKVGAVTEQLQPGNAAANRQIVEAGMTRLGVTVEGLQRDPVMASRLLCAQYKDKKAAGQLVDSPSGSSEFEQRVASTIREFEASCLALGYRIA